MSASPATAGVDRTVAALGAGAFISAANLRVADPLLPQVAHDFDVSVGDAAAIVWAFALAYGFFQLVHGSLGDRFGKFRMVTLMTLLSAAGVAGAAFAESLAGLVALRIAAGATTAAIIPLAMAWIGDAVPYERRQATIARFLFGQILGTIFGQAAGGVFGEFLSWRAVFLLLAAVYVAVAGVLALELRSGRVSDRGSPIALSPGSMARRYLDLAARRRVRLICGLVAVEGGLFYGGFAFYGAFLRHDFGVDYAAIGALTAGFGVGGFAYAATARRAVAALGEGGMALAGGAGLALCFALATVAQPLLGFAAVMVGTGLAFYLIHATLQANATQMAPEARGSAVALFASALFLGQSAGVALCGAAIDAVGYRPVFVAVGVGLLGVGIAFRAVLARPG